MPNQTRPEYRATWQRDGQDREYSDASLTLESIIAVAEAHDGTVEINHGTGWEAFTPPAAD